MNINRNNNQKPFEIIEAPIESYDRKKDTCPICLDTLNPLRHSALRVIAMHRGENGHKHPMHAVCLKNSIQNKAYPNNTSTNNTQTGKCPVCRDTIYWQNRSLNLLEKVVVLSTYSMIATVFHAVFSCLTQKPMLVAVTPYALDSFLSINAIFIEHREIGLKTPLNLEVTKEVSKSILKIGAPLIASACASEITDSTLLNSFITGTLPIIFLANYILKSYAPLKEI